MLKKYPDKVNLVIKHYPLRKHKFAQKASVAALAAARQDKYNEITKALLKNYRKLNNETIKKCAEEAGLDMQKFDQDFNDPALNKIISQDMRLGSHVKVRGVPALYINGKPVKNRSISGLSQMVEDDLEKLK